MTVPTMAELDEWTDALRLQFTDFKKHWHRYHAHMRAINERADEVLAEKAKVDGTSRPTKVAGWGLERQDMHKSWLGLETYLETFTLEREKQTARIITALQEVEAIKEDLQAQQAKLIEEQEQMRKEQAVLREYFDTLKSQNEALMATRNAPPSAENSTLSEIKDLIKGLKDD